MKPVELVTHCLRNSCPPGGVVYEPFGGSGTTLMAAHTTSRIARVVELDPRYIDVICRRFQEHTGVLPVLASSGETYDFAAHH
jgi:DNA modification methylase